ncbi:MAG: hypothetical protein ABH847_02490 [Candidatus Omnitrophota bacterium]
MKNKISRWGVFILMSVTMMGCATTGYRETSAEIEKSLAVASTLRFDDIPVPSGFLQISNESFIFQSESLRAGVLKYSGKSSPDVVMQFYKEQMSLYNWQLINLIEYGKKQLNYEKTGQSCIITIEGARSKSVLTISVGPKSERTKIVK